MPSHTTVCVALGGRHSDWTGLLRHPASHAQCIGGKLAVELSLSCACSQFTKHLSVQSQAWAAGHPICLDLCHVAPALAELAWGTTQAPALPDEPSVSAAWLSPVSP